MSSLSRVGDPVARGFAAVGAVVAALAVAGAAYASHGLSGEAQARLSIAAAFAFGHGVALLALLHLCQSRLQRLGMLALVLGVLLFSGSLAAAALFHGTTRFAPLGGGLLILAWLYLAVVLVLPQPRE